MSSYLFVHFKEKKTPDGEQVYFGLSRDGFNWEQVNGGRPVLWSYSGDMGVRDHTIVRNRHNGRFYILATDLSLAYGMRGKYKNSWKNVSENGSKCLSVWESADLVNWSEHALVKVGSDEMGCAWAPDIIEDRQSGDYILHWSSSHSADNYKKKRIYFSRTKDFAGFTQPELLYEKEDSGIIDSAMYEEDGFYYLFVKCENNPAKIIMLKSGNASGPFERVRSFDESMSGLEAGKYEAPTAVKTNDGRWCLFLDYYGAPGKGQGYVPFVADSLRAANFKRSDYDFSFPYGFKHGTILTIGEDEYERIKNFDFESGDYNQ